MRVLTRRSVCAVLALVSSGLADALALEPTPSAAAWTRAMYLREIRALERQGKMLSEIDFLVLLPGDVQKLWTDSEKGRRAADARSPLHVLFGRDIFVGARVVLLECRETARRKDQRTVRVRLGVDHTERKIELDLVPAEPLIDGDIAEGWEITNIRYDDGLDLVGYLRALSSQ